MYGSEKPYKPFIAIISCMDFNYNLRLQNFPIIISHLAASSYKFPTIVLSPSAEEHKKRGSLTGTS